MNDSPDDDYSVAQAHWVNFNWAHPVASSIFSPLGAEVTPPSESPAFAAGDTCPIGSVSSSLFHGSSLCTSTRCQMVNSTLPVTLLEKLELLWELETCRTALCLSKLKANGITLLQMQCCLMDFLSDAEVVYFLLNPFLLTLLPLW